MRIHLRKLMAIIEVKGKAIFSKNFIIMPIFALGFTYLIKKVYGSINDIDMSGYTLSLGVLMNVCMTGIYLVAATLAEEKEKNTLRTLMTSSVNGLEFFLGSLIPILLLMMIVNVLCVLISGFQMTNFENWCIFLLVTTAGTMTTPALLIFMMIPMFKALNEILSKISNFMFTGIIMNVIDNISKHSTAIDIQNIIILIVEIVLSIILFLILYKKNGYEID